MVSRARFAMLLVLAFAAASAMEGWASARRRVGETFDLVARENQERLRAVEVARRSEELRARAAAEAAWATRRWKTFPAPERFEVPVPPPALVRRAPPPVEVPVPEGLRQAAGGIAGAIAPAAKGGKAGGPARAASAGGRAGVEASPGREEPPEKPPERKPGTGLRGEYWKFVDEELRDFPDVGKRLPKVVRVDPGIEFASLGAFRLPFLARNLAVRWSGFLFAEDDGVYTFAVGSDDGMRLYLDGRLVIDNGGLHPHTERSAEVYLARGFHPIEATFFQNESDASAFLSWIPARGEPGIVPQAVLYPAEMVRAEEAPRIEKIQPPTARSGETILIEGSGFPATPEPVEALFGGIDMRAEWLDPRTIRATVPLGVDRAQIVVRVRDVSSLGVPYECSDVFGLLGEYAASPDGAPITVFAEAPRLGSAAAFRRVERAIAFYSPAAFGLPFAPRRFAARYAGSLYVHEAGAYRFRLTSDDGSRLSLDGYAAVDLDGLHGMTSGEAEVHLERGMHDIAIDYFQNDGGAGLLLEWVMPGQRQPSLVPRRFLYPPLVSADAPVPRIDELDPPEPVTGETFEILGAGFGGDPATSRVLLNGKPIAIEATSPARIVARLPADARSGALLVQAGEIVSEPRQVKVQGHGLRAAYFKFGEEIHLIPDLLRTAPALERIDPQVFFGEGYSFGLPFEPHTFAARWTGSIETPVAGRYKLHLWSDDGSRLLLDGREVIENDGLHGYHSVAAEVDLTPGRHPIAIEFFENYGHAAIDFWWTVPGKNPARVPETALFPDR